MARPISMRVAADATATSAAAVATGTTFSLLFFSLSDIGTSTLELVQTRRRRRQSAILFALSLFSYRLSCVLDSLLRLAGSIFLIPTPPPPPLIASQTVLDSISVLSL